MLCPRPLTLVRHEALAEKRNRLPGNVSCNRSRRAASKRTGALYPRTIPHLTNHHEMTMKKPRLHLTILHAACLAGLFFPGSAKAVDWSANSGNWNVPANWVGGVAPTSGQDAVIKNSGTALLPTGVAGTSFGAFIGFQGNGTLNISGGNLVTTNDARLGFFAGNNGSAILSSGTWAITQNLDIGVSGTGSLVMSGGNLTALVSTIGANSGAVGTASLSGGVWSNFTLDVGSNGTGSLSITGGLASAGFTAIGGNTNGVGSLTISSGTLQNTRSGVGLYVGYFGNGTLNVSGSAAVTTNDASIGDQVSRSGTANVSGGTWSSNGTLFVGNSGTGRLNISGGLVTSGTAVIGSQSGALGVATVSGGTWNNASNLRVGDNGAGTLNLTDTGVVTLNAGSGTMFLRKAVGSSSGTFNLGTGGVAGTLNAAEISGGGGVLNFNHTGTAVFSTRLTNNMVVNKSGAGTTILTGSNSWFAFGASTINGGTLQIGNGGADGTWGSANLMNNANLAFNRSGTLAMSSTIAGSGTVRQIGPGVTVLSGSNAYTGGTVVSAGTLRASHTKALGNGNVVVIDGGIFSVDAGVDLNLGVSNGITLEADGLSTYRKDYSAAEALNRFDAITSANDSTDAMILNGTAPIAMSLNASFATAPSSPASNDATRISDVLSLDGLGSTVFVMQLSYTPLPTPGFDETALRIGWLDGGAWTALGTGSPVLGAYNNSLVVGVFGVDVANDVVWVVTNHNSEFSVINPVPEPSTVVLLTSGAIAIALLRRRRKA